MLGTCCSFKGFPLTLKSVNICLSGSGCQVGIFAICLVTTPPSGIAKNIYIWRPESQPMVDIPVFPYRNCVIFCSPLSGSHITQFFNKSIIEHSRQSYGLRETCRSAASGDTVQRFIPPVVCRDAEPFYSRRIVSQLARFFFQSHLSNKISCFLFSLFSVHN